MPRTEKHKYVALVPPNRTARRVRIVEAFNILTYDSQGVVGRHIEAQVCFDIRSMVDDVWHGEDDARMRSTFEVLTVVQELTTPGARCYFKKVVGEMMGDNHVVFA